MNSLYLATDFILAVSLTVMLWRMRSGIERTDSVIRKFTVYIISTSFVTVAIAGMF